VEASLFESIDNYVSTCLELTDEELNVFHGFLTRHKIGRKTMLLREGEICRFEAFIIKGCIRSYFIDEQGYETIIQFATENWWVSDLASFYDESPSRMFIETLEDSEVFMIDHEQKEELFIRLPQFERLFRILVQRSLSVLQERYFNSMSLPAKDRYGLFVQTYPDLLHRVPQHMIARYLGISPEFLSKIRGELSHEKKH
jgi:CRP-like cAMP-binding protein